MPGILCEHCTAACCRYVALPIETPDTRAEFDDIRWYLIHANISVFVEDGEWFISFATPCRHLQADHRCGIYQTRPAICRKYTADNCDYHSGDYGWELHFTSPEHLDQYVRTHLRAKPRSAAGKRASKPAASGVRAKLPAKRRLPRRPAAVTTDRAGTALPDLPAPD